MILCGRHDFFALLGGVLLGSVRGRLWVVPLACVSPVFANWFMRITSISGSITRFIFLKMEFRKTEIRIPLRNRPGDSLKS